MKHIKPLQKLDATISVPGSKSYTQRALIISSLASGISEISNLLIAEDTKYLIQALRFFGAEIELKGTDASIKGTGGTLALSPQTIYLGNNGTAMRFLISMASLSNEETIIDGNKRLRERPIQPLLEVLRLQGVSFQQNQRSESLPVSIKGGHLNGGYVVFNDIESSQYVSAFLIVSPFASKNVEIELTGQTVSQPYIGMTIDVMRHFGVHAFMESSTRFYVKVPQHYTGASYKIEGDVSSASYFFLAAVLLKGRARLLDITPSTKQGDIKVLDIFESLGCRVTRGNSWIEITGSDLSTGPRSFDMGDIPDMVPTIAVLSAFRKGETSIKNVAHLRLKESNRLEALVRELGRIGVHAKETDNGLIINGGAPHGAVIKTYDDHRIAMSFAVGGLAVPGITITDEQCVQKSFPGFWNTLEGLY